jgi:hypothetical protein
VIVEANEARRTPAAGGTLAGRLVVTAGFLAALVATLALAVGAISIGMFASAAVAFFFFPLGSCGVLLAATVRVFQPGFREVRTLSLIGGTVALICSVESLIYAGFTDPCYEQVNCSRGATLTSAAFGTATVGFFVACAIGTIVAPITISLVQRRT